MGQNPEDFARGVRKEERGCLGVDGRDGSGNKLTPQQIKTALKINQIANEREDDFDKIARDLNLKIDKIAQHIVNLPSPEGTRQIVKKVDAKKVFGQKRNSLYDGMMEKKRSVGMFDKIKS